MTALLLLVAVTLYLRSVWHVCTGDELRYFYQFDLKPGQTYFHFNHLQPIRTLDDVVQSQINHYQTVNGRTPVHTIEQLFSGVLPTGLFYVLNIFVWLGALGLFVRLSGGRGRRWPYVALPSLMLWMLCMPEPGRLYTSINLALNYLWPAAGCMLVLAAWQRYKCVGGHGVVDKLVGSHGVLLLLGLVCGWSNEGYVFPLAGALGVYYMWHLKRLRGRAAALCVGFWIGAALMLAAPGNWIRASQVSDPMQKLQSLLSLAPQMSVLWLLLIVLGVLCIRHRAMLRSFLRSNAVLTLCCVLSILMTAAVHTGARSLAPMSLYCGLLLMRLLGTVTMRPQRLLQWLYVAAGCALATFELCLTVEHYHQHRSVEAVVADYARSADGRVVYKYKAPADWQEPFVYHLPPNTDGATRYQWTLLEAHLKLQNGTPGKRLLVMVSKGYQLPQTACKQVGSEGQP